MLNRPETPIGLAIKRRDKAMRAVALARFELAAARLEHIDSLAALKEAIAIKRAARYAAAMKAA
jgi:hypothetical protein